MVNKALRYLNNTINQDTLFGTINKEIREIIRPYEFKKVIYIRNSNVGEITIELQDPIPTKLIKQLDDYFELEGIIEKTQYHIDIIYKLEKGF